MTNKTNAIDVVDLHTHSVFSDGAATPEEYVERFYREKKELLEQGLNIRAVALTDHESMNGIEPLVRAFDRYEFGNGITGTERVFLLNGLEISTFSRLMDIHVLGYFPHADLKFIDKALKEPCEENFSMRTEHYRNKSMQMLMKIICGRKSEITGAKISYDLEKLYAAAEELFGEFSREKFSSKLPSDIIQWELPFPRLVVRRAIEEAGIAPANVTAYYTSRTDPNKHLESYYMKLNSASSNPLPVSEIKRMAEEDIGSCVYMPEFARRLIKTEVAVSLIAKAGGKPFFAHPFEFIREEGRSFFETYVKRTLVPAGLAGIECHYPEHDPELTSYLLDFAGKNNLLASGGTDTHLKKDYEKFAVGHTGIVVPFELYKKIVG